MRALRAGLPLLGIPAGGVDQVVITEVIDEWGAGRALGPDPTVPQIRDAAVEVLGDDRYAKQAQQLSTHLVGTNGAANAADSIESLLPS
jgi:UDP:flavonoid glycosyltransferase YjiC (YdhE family)